MVGREVSTHHHPSHADLLVHEVTPRRADVDAIIVPTARPPAYLRDVIQLARELRRPLLVLCSRWSTAEKAWQEARLVGVHMIATDVAEPAGLPRFETADLIAGGRFARTTDTSLKRNIGIAVAAMVGWRRVVFIDDDITGIQPDDIRAAAALLDDYDMVGLANDGFADNSVVCHARRAVGEFQDSFVGGGAMAVNVGRDPSFFPNIYNEDWFYMVDRGRLRRTAKTGKVLQKWYDPFDRPGRARSQELGDCLAEGLYALLDDRRPARAMDERYWAAFLEDRKQLIAEIMEKIPGLDETDLARDRMSVSMRAAQSQRSYVTPALCVAYMRALRADRERWRDWLDELPVIDMTPRRALTHLGLSTTHISKGAA
jgi:hypothetical protein